MPKTIHNLDRDKVYELCEKITDRPYVPLEHGEGWDFILYVGLKKIEHILKRGNVDHLTIDQIKEKFFSMRFYITCGSNTDGEDVARIYDIATDVENQSYHICEVCVQNF